MGVAVPGWTGGIGPQWSALCSDEQVDIHTRGCGVHLNPLELFGIARERKRRATITHTLKARAGIVGTSHIQIYFCSNLWDKKLRYHWLCHSSRLFTLFQVTEVPLRFKV